MIPLWIRVKRTDFIISLSFSTVQVQIDNPHTNLYQYSLNILEQLFMDLSNMLSKLKCFHKWLIDFDFYSEKRQRNDEICTHNPNSNWNYSDIYESILICLAYLKRP